MRRFPLPASFLVPVLLAPPARAQPEEAKARLENHARHLAMRDRSPFKSLEWRWIGPQIMSGRVTDIAVPPGRPFTFYVATASGGLWKTVNDGTTWEPVFDDAPSASVGDVAVAPSKPDIAWVGLGEANIFRSSMSGTGVYKSVDAGKTWQHMGLADSHHVARIVVHPKDPNVVWVAASGHEWTTNSERGVYKTTNGGVTWKRVLYVDERTGAIDLVLDPSNPRTLYASMWDRIRRKWSDPKPGPGSGIHKSVDGGETWRELRKGLPAKGEFGRVGLDVGRSRPNVIYALIDNHEIKRKAKPGERDSYGRPRKDVIKGAEVFRSDDRGETWAKVSPGDRTLERLFSTYGWVFGQIRVDPNDENTTWILGVPLLRSTDGGKSYQRVSYRGLHGDHHALWIDPADSDRVINGNDGGINLSYDGGKTWKNDESLPVVQLYNVAYDMRQPFRVFGSIQDNGSWMGPVTHRPGRDPKTDWQRAPGGEASYHQIDPEDPNVVFSEGFYGRIQRSTLEPRKTVNILPQPAGGEPGLRGQWLAPFQISPHNPRILYHGMQCVFRSVDRGDHWERISPDLTYNDPEKQGDISFQTITTLCESPKRFGLVYAGTDDGRAWVTRDGGHAWTEIVHGLVPRMWVSRVVASRFDEGTVYLAQNGKRDNRFAAWVFRSTDYGATWKSIADGIPGGPVNVIQEDPKHAGVVYAGTDLGVYVSLDAGKTWSVLGSGLPITFVHDLVIHPRDDVLVIATHGRGMFTLDVKPVHARAKKRQRTKIATAR